MGVGWASPWGVGLGWLGLMAATSTAQFHLDPADNSHFCALLFSEHRSHPKPLPDPYSIGCTAGTGLQAPPFYFVLTNTLGFNSPG